MESKIRAQSDMYHRIENARVNFKKSPKDRLTSNYIETRIDILNGQWETFNKVHEQLISEVSDADYAELDYFNEDFYTKTEDLYADYKTELKASLEKCTRVPTKTQDTCRICKKKHHSLLHSTTTNVQSNNVKVTTQSNSNNVVAATATASDENDQTNITTCFSNNKSQVLLATALVKAETKNGSFMTLRSLLDQGSQASFITESAVQLLGLKKETSKSVIFGVGSECNSKHVVHIKLQSIHDPTFNIKVIMESKIRAQSDMYHRIENARVNFKKSPKDRLTSNYIETRIDILNGQWETFNKVHEQLISEVSDADYAELDYFNEDFYTKTEDLYADYKTELKASLEKCTRVPTKTQDTSLEFLNPKITKCTQSHHVATKNNDKISVPCSYCSANDHKLGNCKKFANETLLARRNFVQTSNLCFNCLGANHSVIMCRLPTRCRICKKKHHSLLHSTTTNVQSNNVKVTTQSNSNNVVAATATASDENDQTNITTCFSNNKSQVLLATALVKAETKNGSFMTLRSLLDQGSQASFITESAVQLLGLKKETSKSVIFGVGTSERILNDFYMDDLLTGCETVLEGKQIYKEINELLSKGGFELQKWSSNNETLLKEISKEIETTESNLELKIDEIIKILGLTWNRRTDNFEYSVQLPPLVEPITKRKVISDIARLFDPMGWIAPAIIKAKIFIQQLWLAGIGWDEELPPKLLNDWISYRGELTALTQFRLPRWIGMNKTCMKLELHGFSDASADAYAAVVYARVVDESGTVRVTLITCKTKVAPIKQVSIPRLELCGAVLLARLLREVSEVLKVPKTNLHAWTDSTIVLAWLSSHPSRWKTFIANRVSEILNILNRDQWSHVSSTDNPADCASRGVNPSECEAIPLWKAGPAWLKDTNMEYDRKELSDTDLEEKGKKVCHVTREDEFELWIKFSSLQKLTRVIAYCLRFISKTKKSTEATTFPIWWSSEYLTQFLQRHRWANQTPEPKIGDLVLVKEDDLPPAKWLMGIIIEKHKGVDNITRVVSLKCKDAIIKRPIVKLCVLPVAE
ncbi:unnamed protein product [Parnassius mnemosyne]|uniref:DUF5641 domain-containing protein n=1 Tax=Parnassius mnemosyne TaxID=213953 RepID=A0AAV1KTU7_9NEOP